MPEKYNFTNWFWMITTSNISWELHLKRVNLFMTDKQKDDIFSSFITGEILILILMYIIQIRITCDVPIRRKNVGIINLHYQ